MNLIELLLAAKLQRQGQTQCDDNVIVNVDMDTNPATADESYSEIVDAILAGKTVVFAVTLSLAKFELTTIVFAGGVIFASGVTRYGYATGLISLSYESDGTISINTSEVQMTPSVLNVSGDSQTIHPEDNTRYVCGTLTSLTITSPPATGAYTIVFTSGATATTTTFPATILGLEDFAAAANTLYEINVLDGRAVVGSWAVSTS